MGEVADIVDYEIEPVRRQRLHLRRQGIDDQRGHDTGFQRNPEQENEKGRYPAPERDIPAVIARQRMQDANVAGCAGKRPVAAEIVAEHAQCEQGGDKGG
jgi:hypothetical protein